MIQYVYNEGLNSRVKSSFMNPRENFVVTARHKFASSDNCRDD